MESNRPNSQLSAYDNNANSARSADLDSTRPLLDVDTKGQPRAHGVGGGDEKSQSVSPTYPLDIVVKKIHTVVSAQKKPTGAPLDSSDSEESINGEQFLAKKEINRALEKQGFRVVEKEFGADCEYYTYEPSRRTPSPNRPSTSKHMTQEAVPPLLELNALSQASSATSGRFKKGHRRAYSMPTGDHKENKAVLVVAEGLVQGAEDGKGGPNGGGGGRRRHLVRYRLHPYKANNARVKAKITKFIEQTNVQQPFPDEMIDELEIEINEEEIMCFGQQTPVGIRTVRRFWEHRWRRQDFELLPEWLQDNEFLHTGHRPQLSSFASCFKSIFSLHTETGNIWTHMYGCVAFLGAAAFFLSRPESVVGWQEKAVFAPFFLGAILCLGMSSAFHTLICHSPQVGALFGKLDYAGIALLIIGSFIPWIYYAFYCRTLPKLFYISMIVILGIAALVVSLWDKFSTRAYRPLRAIVFASMGLSAVIPAVHLMVTDGLEWLYLNASFSWLVLMAVLYLAGAGIYAARIPERIFPGKCDIWFHSHQLFHLFVVAAAVVHFYGITQVAMMRLEGGPCREMLYSQQAHDSVSTAGDKGTITQWIDEVTLALDQYFLPY